MPGIDVFEIARRIQHAIKKSGVAIFAGAFAEKLVHAFGKLRQWNIQRGRRIEDALQECREQGSGDSFAGHVADKKSVTPALQCDDVEAIASTEWHESVEPVTET